MVPGLRERVVSTRWRTISRINWIAWRTLLHTDRLRWALICNQTTKMQIVFTRNVESNETSIHLMDIYYWLSFLFKQLNDTPFGWFTLISTFSEGGLEAGVLVSLPILVACLSCFSCLLRVVTETCWPGCSIPWIVILLVAQDAQVQITIEGIRTEWNSRQWTYLVIRWTTNGLWSSSDLSLIWVLTVICNCVILVRHQVGNVWLHAESTAVSTMVQTPLRHPMMASLENHAELW